MSNSSERSGLSKRQIIKGLITALPSMIEGMRNYPQLGPDGQPYANKAELQVVQAAFIRTLLQDRKEKRLARISGESKRSQRRRGRVEATFARAEGAVSLPAVAPALESMARNGQQSEDFTHIQKLGEYGVEAAQRYLRRTSTNKSS